MPDLTAAHRDHARRTLVASGYPIGDDLDHLERLRRTELLEAMATAIALAELRGPAGDPATAWDDGFEAGSTWTATNPGPAGGHTDPPLNPYAAALAGTPASPTDPTDAEEAAYRHGLGQAFAEALAVLTAPNPEASIRHIAAGYGVDRDLDGPPSGGAAALLAAARGGLEVRDGVVVQGNARVAALQRMAGDEPHGHRIELEDGTMTGYAALQPDNAADRRADRMTWTPGDLQITPPPPDGAP